MPVRKGRFVEVPIAVLHCQVEAWHSRSEAAKETGERRGKLPEPISVDTGTELTAQALDRFV